MKLSLNNASTSSQDQISEESGIGSFLLMMILFLGFIASIIYIGFDSFS